MLKRKIIPFILDDLSKNKVILIIGPRQSGKTTVLKMLQEHVSKPYVYYNCDDLDIRSALSVESSAKLRQFIGYDKIIMLDEAQRIENAGLNLKIIHDTMPDIRLIVTGSSAFELSDKINEPLTGRKVEYNLFPLAFDEMVENTAILDEYSHRNLRLVYGSYPEVVLNPSSEVEILQNLCNSYLFKDIFTLFDIRKPDVIEKLLKALAFQVGSEVSLRELAQLLNCDLSTIARYIFMLQSAFIIFRLPNYSNNQRNELKRSQKIYFYDNGIRNALIADYRPTTLRDDIGKLWENYIVSEFIKRKNNHRLYHKEYFWRSTNGSEIDYLEMKDNQLTAFEIKWNAKKAGKFRGFLNHYPDAVVKTINSENYYMQFTTTQ
jgi:predicted AAA+ superfamily ATPase